jgi:hypothetical protein
MPADSHMGPGSAEPRDEVSGGVDGDDEDEVEDGEVIVWGRTTPEDGTPSGTTTGGGAAEGGASNSRQGLQPHGDEGHDEEGSGERGATGSGSQRGGHPPSRSISGVAQRQLMGQMPAGEFMEESIEVGGGWTTRV